MGNTLLGIGQVRGTDAEVTGNTLGSGNLNGPTANALYTTEFLVFRFAHKDPGSPHLEVWL